MCMIIGSLDMEIEDIEREWLGIRCGLGTEYEEKWHSLFEDENEESVSQCMELLLSFGESALCAVIEEKDGELCLRSEIDFAHRNLWEREILAQVSLDERSMNGRKVLALRPKRSYQK